MDQNLASETTESSVFPRFKDSRRILAVALIKLLVDGLLFYLVLYGPLHKAGAFRYLSEDYEALCATCRSLSVPQPGYAVYFWLGLLLSAFLYLYTVFLIDVRRRVSYLLYAGFLGIDVLFVLQPSKLVLTVLLCALILTFLKFRSAVLRYSLSAAVLILYGVFVWHPALIVIPVYLIARLWQRNDTYAIRVCILLMLAFCLLYQAGVISKIYQLHPSITTTATYRRRFPDENYMGHVSYYLLDTLLTLVRILLPVDALILGNGILVRIYAAAQLVTVTLLFRRMRRLIQIDWRGTISADDRLQMDSFVILTALVCGQCATAQEPLEALRFVSACYPFLLYLTFSADNRVIYPVLKRDLSGSCPVVFCHKGDDSYVFDVLQRAGRSCGYRNVVLLGDESNRGYIANWVDASHCNEEEIVKFRNVFRPFGIDSVGEFDLACFERHFALYGFMKERGIERCFLCDSDVLVYGNLCKLNIDDADFACTGTASDAFLKESVSPHCAYWKIDRLRQFLDFVLYVYRSNTNWLKEVCQKQTEEGKPSRITDTVLLTAWCKILSGYDKGFRYRNLCEVKTVSDGDQPESLVVWDYALSSADNLETDEYRFNEHRQTKEFRFRNHIPYFTRREDGSEVAVMCLHCSRCSRYIPLLIRETRFAPLYMLNRLMYRK
jgi:Predicted membrane-associated HD superfamily hydrolase